MTAMTNKEYRQEYSFMFLLAKLSYVSNKQVLNESIIPLKESVCQCTFNDQYIDNLSNSQKNNASKKDSCSWLKGNVEGA
jgi:hypothetical protein